MLTLYLFRHAKSSWTDPGLDDHARTLSLRGYRDAPRMGAFMAEMELRPDLVLCSTSTRTRETLELMAPRLEIPSDRIMFEDSIYEVAPANLIARIRRLPDERRRVLIIGHNPGMQGAALDLVGGGEADGMRRLAKKFPTAALAVITFEATSWSAIRTGSGHLEMFVRPKDLTDHEEPRRVAN